jgi:hypothetical protein
MRRPYNGLVKFLVFLVIVLGAGYYFRSALAANVLPKLQTVKDNIISIISPLIPCKTPLPYTLSNFDTRFNISQEYFLNALTEAEGLWEKSAGKELFVYKPESTERRAIKVNLIYDYRQEATSKLNNIDDTLSAQRTAYNTQKAKYDALNISYKKALSAFNARVAAYNTKSKDYQARVSYWNKKGGAPKAEYDKLEAERQALTVELSGINQEQMRLNKMVSDINALAKELNSLASTLNLSVNTYNTINAGRGESFEEGIYVEENGAKHIDIFEFSNKTKLVRVLAHELGHALGLEHVADTKAIMYELNNGTTVALSAGDVEALSVLCAAK